MGESPTVGLLVPSNGHGRTLIPTPLLPQRNSRSLSGFVAADWHVRLWQSAPSPPFPNNPATLPIHSFIRSFSLRRWNRFRYCCLCYCDWPGGCVPSTALPQRVLLCGTGSLWSLDDDWGLLTTQSLTSFTLSLIRPCFLLITLGGFYAGKNVKEIHVRIIQQQR